MPKSSRMSGALVLLGAWATLSACGGSSSSPSAPTVSATPSCTQSTLFQGSVGQIGPSTVLRAPFQTSAAPRLDVIVDWTFPESPIAVFLVAQNTCSLEQLNARTCTFLIRSESGSKPRKASASNLAAGTYELLIGNGGAQVESASVGLFISSASCPPVASSSTQGEDGALRFGTMSTR